MRRASAVRGGRPDPTVTGARTRVGAASSRLDTMPSPASRRAARTIASTAEGDDRQRRGHERNEVVAGEGVHVLAPPEGRRPGEPTGPGSGVGDHPEHEAHREHHDSHAGGDASGLAELRGHRAHRCEHHRRHGDARGVDDAVADAEPDVAVAAGEPREDRNRGGDDTDRRPETDERRRGRALGSGVAGEHELPAPGVLLPAEEPGRGQQAPQRGDRREEDEELVDGVATDGVERGHGPEQDGQPGVASGRHRELVATGGRRERRDVRRSGGGNRGAEREPARDGPGPHLTEGAAGDGGVGARSAALGDVHRLHRRRAGERRV